MHEAPVTNINAGMRGFSPLTENDDVSCPQLTLCHLTAIPAELFYGARQCTAGTMEIHVTDQAAAVESGLWRIATVAVWRANQAERVHDHIGRRTRLSLQRR